MYSTSIKGILASIDKDLKDADRAVDLERLYEIALVLMFKAERLVDMLACRLDDTQ